MGVADAKANIKKHHHHLYAIPKNIWRAVL
jgi:hypothetical protein